jgi:ATP-binding cassette subfamily C (CFTR/MRP) protein 10
LRVECASTLLLLFTAFLTVHGIIPGAVAGLALSTVMAIAKNVSSLAWTLAELEIKMISVERLKRYYDDMPKEGSPDMMVYRSVPEQWPSNRIIDITDVYVKYQSRPTPVLDHINIRVKGGERIGIVGRTGMLLRELILCR